MQCPACRLPPVLKPRAVPVHERLCQRAVAVEVTERCGVMQGESQRFDAVVEADQPYRAGKVARGPQHGQRVGRGPQADVPDHKLANVSANPFHQAQLFDIKRLRLGHGSNDGMKCLAIGQRMDAVDAVGEPDDFVSG